MAETIGKVVLCYDVSDKNTEVKNALKEMGYSDVWLKLPINKLCDMPDTTVWHSTKTVSGATKDIQEVCNSLNVTLEKSFSALTRAEVDGYNS